MGRSVDGLPSIYTEVSNELGIDRKLVKEIYEHHINFINKTLINNEDIRTPYLGAFVLSKGKKEIVEKIKSMSKEERIIYFNKKK